MAILPEPFGLALVLQKYKRKAFGSESDRLLDPDTQSIQPPVEDIDTMAWEYSDKTKQLFMDAVRANRELTSARSAIRRSRRARLDRPAEMPCASPFESNVIRPTP